MNQPILSVKNLSKSYPSRHRGGDAVPVLEGMSFDVAAGEFFTIVGPSGAGKTTLLRCLSGLMPATSGEVLVNGAKVDRPPRELALVFQDYSRSLFPWLTVRRNVELPLRAQGLSRAEVAERASRALSDVGLAGEDDKHPWQLSGGMQQRVAIARAIAHQPQVMVLDEPFASVDAQTRADLEDLLIKVRRETGATFVFVTHDVDEAVYLSDRVAVVTKAPSRINRVIDINLPSGRQQLETKALPRFAELRAEIFGTIRDVVTAGAPEYSI